MEAEKLRHELVVKRQLIAAHRAPVSRVERKDDRRTAQFVQRNQLVRSGVQTEVRRKRPGLKRRRRGLRDPVAIRTSVEERLCPAMLLDMN